MVTQLPARCLEAPAEDVVDAAQSLLRTGSDIPTNGLFCLKMTE
jgi:hypothetical protein